MIAAFKKYRPRNAVDTYVFEWEVISWLISVVAVQLVPIRAVWRIFSN